MAVLSFVKLLMIFVVFHSSEGHRCCDRRIFVPKYADKVISARDLKVNYTNRMVSCGETIGPLDVLHVPTIIYNLQKKCTYATVLAITPDPVNFLFIPYLLYLVHNVPAWRFKRGFKGQNQQNVADKGSPEGDYGAKWVVPKFVSATKGTHDIKVLYFLYCQPKKIPREDIKLYLISVQRKNFLVKDYAKKMHLGNPVAVTYNRELATQIQLP